MRLIQGVVTSLKRQKTATVLVTRLWRHPLYQKSVKRSKKYAAHYENLNLSEGDLVEMKETRPISKTKRFVITKKIKV
jgi:small subunit ribosomal protein S17